MTAAQNLPVEAKAPLRTGGGVQSIVPQDAEQAFRMAKMIYASGFAPKDMQSPDKIVTAIIAGMEIGLKPFQSVQSFAVVNGRPTIWGDAALGLVQASGYLEDIEETVEGEGDAMVATCRAKRTDRKSEIVRPFSVADAKKAGLWGKLGPWAQYPRRMLALRARAFCLRDGFPDVLKGIGIREEVADYSGPASERAAEASSVTGAQLLAQASDAPLIDAQPTAAEAPVPYILSDFPPKDGDRTGWMNDLKKVIALADGQTVKAIGDALELINEELPEIVRSTFNKALRNRSAELAIANVGK